MASTIGKWIARKASGNEALLARELGIDEIFAALLCNRGINSRNAAREFINPSLKSCADFSIAKDCDKATARVLGAIENNETICVYGDYDVDGVMSTTILIKVINAIIAASTSGAAVFFILPLREKDGYGLNMERAQEIAGRGAKLLIACDNGITAIGEIKRLNGLGVDTVVIDHHEPLPSGIPEAAAVIDPKRLDCPYPYKKMCAAAICMRFAACLYRAAGERFGFLGQYGGLREAVALSAIATFCDIVELTGENRAIAKAGLDIISESVLNEKPLNIGLSALIAERGAAKKPFTAFDAGFIIGPCINAAGRLESAEIAVALFLTEDETEARTLAMRLSALNEARKTATEQGAAAALALAADYNGDKVLCIYSASISEAVAGIVAGRVKESLNRPTIVLTESVLPLPNGAPVVKGSCRSIEGYDIFKALYSISDLFIRFGGHPMAAGLTIEKEHVGALRHRLNEECHLTDKDLTRTLYIDAFVPLSFATVANAERLLRLEPFGKGNEPPLFASHARVVWADLIGQSKNTLRVSLEDGGVCFSAIMFNGASYLPACVGDVEIAYHLEINDFRGERSARLRLIGIKKPETKHEPA